MKRFIRNNAATIIIAATLVVVLVGLYFLNSAKNKTDGVASTSRPAAAAPVAVTQPPSAKDVAVSLHCTGFKDLGSAPDVGVVDSGSCWIKGKKYAINTFMNSSIRDTWLKAAEGLGVVPKWETDTSVTYKSVT